MAYVQPLVGWLMRMSDDIKLIRGSKESIISAMRVPTTGMTKDDIETLRDRTRAVIEATIADLKG